MCQVTESPAIAINQKTWKLLNFLSGEFQVITFMYRAKTASRNFSTTHRIAWKRQFEF